MKDDFISLASHQLRTPLTAIRWISERLMRPATGQLTEKQQGLVKDVQNSTIRLITLVNDLLNITRIESGRLTIEPTQSNIGELVQSIIEEVHEIADAKKITIQVEIHDQLPEIVIDVKLIRQALANIIQNAIKYTSPQGMITILAYKTVQYIAVAVTDTGLGIPTAQQSQLFQRFFRASNVTGAEYDGTGLGLYLVKNIVEASGGTVLYSSQENVGTTFVVYLPLSGSPSQKGEVRLS
jgi:signal transduction histidine kinase